VCWYGPSVASASKDTRGLATAAVCSTEPQHRFVMYVARMMLERLLLSSARGLGFHYDSLPSPTVTYPSL
jgi:hypothetical protein